MNRTHHLLVTHTYTDISTRAPATGPPSNGSAREGRGPITVATNTHIKCLSRAHECSSFPVIMPRSLHTQHLSVHRRGPSVPKQPSRPDFCSGIAGSDVFSWFLKEESFFCGRRLRQTAEEGGRSERKGGGEGRGGGGGQQLLAICSLLRPYSNQGRLGGINVKPG